MCNLLKEKDRVTPIIIVHKIINYYNTTHEYYSPHCDRADILSSMSSVIPSDSEMNVFAALNCFREKLFTSSTVNPLLHPGLRV